MSVDTLGRALQLYRRTTTSRSALLLLVANLIPLAGVLFFGWSLWTILVLYWIENGIVGFWNVPKLLLARGSLVPAPPSSPGTTAPDATAPDATRPDGNGAASRVRVLGQVASSTAGRVGLAIFFVMHYGIFWFGHGVFVFLLPTFLGGSSVDCSTVSPGSLGGDAPEPFPGALDLIGSCTGAFGGIDGSNVAIAAIALFISHGASFLLNYVGRGEYLTASPSGQMGAPYGRVVVLHLTIIFGAFVVAALGTSIGLLLSLITLKTALDLGLHLRERRAADARIPAG